MEIDLHRCLDQTLIDVGGRHVLHVTQPRGQRHARGVAPGLSGDVEVDGALQPFAGAGNLREASRRDEQRAREHDRHKSNAVHRFLPQPKWRRNNVNFPS
jgi:hypothetical protein